MNRKFVLALAFCLFSSTAFTVAPALAAGKSAWPAWPR